MTKAHRVKRSAELAVLPLVCFDNKDTKMLFVVNVKAAVAPIDRGRGNSLWPWPKLWSARPNQAAFILSFKVACSSAPPCPLRISAIVSRQDPAWSIAASDPGVRGPWSASMNRILEVGLHVSGKLDVAMETFDFGNKKQYPVFPEPVLFFRTVGINWIPETLSNFSSDHCESLLFASFSIKLLLQVARKSSMEYTKASESLWCPVLCSYVVKHIWASFWRSEQCHSGKSLCSDIMTVETSHITHTNW